MSEWGPYDDPIVAPTSLQLTLTPLEHAWLLDQLQARPTQKRVLGEGMTGDKLLAFREKVAGLKEAAGQ